MNNLSIELAAGLDSQQQQVIEQLDVELIQEGQYQIKKSPAFIRGIAAGDTLAHIPGSYTFTIIARSGNLSIRVYSQHPGALEQRLSELEKLGATLDIKASRLLVYTIHVSCGFKIIEDTLSKALGDDPQSQWMYGNVYDPVDGSLLNWWQDILAPQ